MPTQPRKVALINVQDYPRSEYCAYWEIRVQGEDDIGYEYGARILSYEPVKWSYQGKVTDDYPEGAEVVPMPVLLDKDRKDPKAVKAFREECMRISKQNPVPLYELAGVVGAADTRDEADTMAQTYVLNKMKEYRREDVA